MLKCVSSDALIIVCVKETFFFKEILNKIKLKQKNSIKQYCPLLENGPEWF